MTKYVVITDGDSDIPTGAICKFFPAHTEQDSPIRRWVPDCIEHNGWNKLALLYNYSELSFETEEERLHFKMLYPDWEEE